MTVRALLGLAAANGLVLATGSCLLWGVRGANGIAAYLGIDERRAYYLIDRGSLPVKRLAHRTIVASKTELQRVFAAAAEPGAA